MTISGSAFGKPRRYGQSSVSVGAMDRDGNQYEVDYDEKKLMQSIKEIRANGRRFKLQKDGSWKEV